MQGGDYNRRCSVVCPPDSPEECFDLSLVEYRDGGRSIYSDSPDGLFADEPSALHHARGTLSMSNPGRADANGSQFFVAIPSATESLAHLDGSYVVFGQVLAGYDVMAALGAAGRKDGSTLQRCVIEECGVLPSGWEPAAGAARMGLAAGRAPARRAARLARPPPQRSMLRRGCCAGLQALLCR